MPDQIDEELNLRIVKIGPSNMAQAQSIFYRGYLKTDFARTMLNDKKPGYEQRLRGFIRETLIHHYSGSNISLAMVENDKIIGAAMVTRSNQGPSFVSSWRWRLGMYSIAGIGNTERIRSYYQKVEDTLSEVDHYWILLKAFLPEYQYGGRGRTLLRAIHEQCELDPSFKGISIDTARPDLRKFFESEGYEKMGDVQADPTLSMDQLFLPRKGTEAHTT